MVIQYIHSKSCQILEQAAPCNMKLKCFFPSTICSDTLTACAMIGPFIVFWIHSEL